MAPSKWTIFLVCAALLQLGNVSGQNLAAEEINNQEPPVTPEVTQTQIQDPIDTVPVLSDILPSEKIYNGQPVGYSFYVALVTYNASTFVKEKEYTLICSGTIIDGKSILTAAHCAMGIMEAIKNGCGVEGWLGVTELRVVPSDGQRRDILIKNLHVQKKYSEKNYKNDIAVINVEPFDAQFMTSVCFTNDNYNSKDVTLIGFGIPVCNGTDYSRNLLKAEGQVYLYTMCNQMAISSPLTKSQACVVVKNRAGAKPSDASPGDAGGPIFYTIDTTDGTTTVVQVGVVSVSRLKKGAKMGQCVEEAYMGLYTRPDRYKSFIQKFAPMANFNC